MKRGKEIRGEKAIYLKMGYLLSEQNEKKKWSTGELGEDWKMERNFNIIDGLETEQDSEILVETKTSACYADYSRHYLVQQYIDRLKFYEIIEDGSIHNYSKDWDH